MAGTSKQTTGIGLRHVRVAVRDDDGTIQIAGAPAVSTAYAGLQAQRARALTITPAEAVAVTAIGDDVAYHTFLESPTDTPTGELRTQASDIDLIALITSVKDFGSPNQRMVAIATDKVGQEDAMILWGSRKAIDSEKSSATFGIRNWETYIILNAYLTARPPTMEQGAIGEFTWTMRANMSAVDHFGRTLTELVHGCTEAAYIIVHTRYKFFMDAFEGDGAEQHFNLTQGAATIYNVATSPIQCFVNGVARACTVDIAGIATVTPAPGDGEKVIIVYQYED